MGSSSSIWRTLKDLLPKRAAAPPDEPQDRRIWSRAQCDLVTTCEIVTDGASRRLAARVRNISRGGIGFHVEEAPITGGLVRIDLPTEEGQPGDTMLAYVMHVTPIGDGKYSVGCVFASELTDDDLSYFGGKRVRAEKSDQRSWVRFASDATVKYSLIPTDVEPNSPAALVNISASGLAMEVSRVIPAGTLLSLDLHSNRTQDDRTILASVARFSPQKDGKWLLGCNFIRELMDDELRAFA